MRELLDDIERWSARGERGIAIATVLATFGSAPRRSGAKLAVSSGGEISGSISGGCVEAAIIDAAREVIVLGRPRVLHFDTSDDSAWEVGLPCGGSIDVLVEPIDHPSFAFLAERVRRNERAVEVTLLTGPDELVGRKLALDSAGAVSGGLSAELDPVGRRLAEAAETATRIEVGAGVELFVAPYPPRPTLVVVGGVHIALALVQLAATVGYRTAVIDPRKSFGTEVRFAGAGRLLTLWPDEAFAEIELTGESAVVVLTHDPKLDDPALVHALRSAAFYVGALGSVRTQEKRRARLLSRGFTPAEVARIRGPVGFDLNAANPEEIALSIMAEIVATQRGAKDVLRAHGGARPDLTVAASEPRAACAQ